jgi:hypothetical protein
MDDELKNKSIGGIPSSGWTNSYPEINLDFRDLYPHIMKTFSITSILRKEKIKRIFQ